eukprot:1466187-Lingulodinium_polyedra.AAC.1
MAPTGAAMAELVATAQVSPVICAPPAMPATIFAAPLRQRLLSLRSLRQPRLPQRPPRRPRLLQR